MVASVHSTFITAVCPCCSRRSDAWLPFLFSMSTLYFCHASVASVPHRFVPQNWPVFALMITRLCIGYVNTHFSNKPTSWSDPQTTSLENQARYSRIWSVEPVTCDGPEWCLLRSLRCPGTLCLAGLSLWRGVSEWACVRVYIRRQVF